MLFSVCKTHNNVAIDFFLAYHDLTDKEINPLKCTISHFPNKSLILLDVDESFSAKFKAKEQYSYAPMDMTCPFVVCEDIHLDIREYFYIKDGIHLPREKSYFNSGMLLINLDYHRKMRSTGYMIDAFIREAGNYECPDQDILNILYGDKVKYVPWELYNLPPMHWNLDIEELSYGHIKYASYPELFNHPKKYVNITTQLRDQAHIIHYLGSLLKPWKYRKGVFYEDLALYSDLWFDCEKEMYLHIPTLEHLS